ncbi:Bifunctional thiamine biosynthesis protein ThiDN [Candidatus Norongarragalina meridionalis]|nr:Bifunctional thiamine biosynthesis protein ThiDN [Candidatus Norongarragalina meridionalis]
MDELPSLGKIPPEFFRKVIYPHLGAKDKSVIVPPTNGVDFGAFECGNNAVVLSADPFFISPSLGWERAAWFAVHILASDVAVSGIPPRYFAVDLNLPPETTADVLKRIWRTVDSECKKLGVNVVTGHTARYAGCNYPMVGGGVMFGVGSRKKLVDRSAMRPGDEVIVTKGPAIETTGLMSVQFPEFLEASCGKQLVKKAQSVFYQMSVVKDAAVVAKTGAATAMHDATECGVWGGLSELCLKYGMDVEKEEVIVQDAVAKTCECFGIDPFIAISEGTLLATVRKGEGEATVKALKKADIPASVVGRVMKKRGLFVDGKRTLHPGTDPFWIAFEEYLKKQAGGNDALLTEVEDVAAALCATAGFLESIPEIGSNLVFAKPGAKSPKEVAAIEGRMRRGINRVLRGAAAYGASHHVAGVVIALSKQGVRSALDVAYSPQLLDAFVRSNMSVAEVSRSEEEPESVASAEGASMPWLALQAVKKHGGVSDVIYDKGAFGKEATIFVLGASPGEVLAKMRRAFRAAGY